MPRLLTNKATLVSGEGKADRLFLEYLKAQYQTRASTNIIHVYKNNKDGHSGGNSVEVIREAMCASANRGRIYDGIVVCLDVDIVTLAPQELYQEALKKCPPSFRSKIPNNYKFIFLTPCLEGLYLDIIQGSHPATGNLCKSNLKKIIGCEAQKFTEATFFQCFPVEKLNGCLLQNYSLNMIVTLLKLSGHNPDYDNWFDQYR